MFYPSIDKKGRNRENGNKYLNLFIEITHIRLTKQPITIPTKTPTGKPLLGVVLV
jgi:hypothetical protein